MEKKNLLAVLALMLALLILVFAAKHAGQSEEDPNLCQWEKRMRWC